MWSIVFSQGATHRAQSPCRVLHTEHSTPTGVLPWSTVLPQGRCHGAQYSHTVLHAEHGPPAVHPQKDTLQEFQAEVPLLSL